MSIDVSDIIAPVLGIAQPHPADPTADVKGYRGHCRHAQTVVDDGARTIVCGSCGATLDALDVLVQYARRERTWRSLDAEIRTATDALEALKAEERKVKARTKNAARKDAEFAVAAERLRNEDERLSLFAVAQEIGELSSRIKRITSRRAQ